MKTKVFTMNLAQAANTYDLCTCTGGVLIDTVQIFGAVVGATFTAVTMQTSNTVPEEILSAAEGAVANIVAGKNIKSFTTKFYLATTKKIQYTISGSTGTGSCSIIVTYRPCINGAEIA
jgi:hypothetical protein